MGTILLDGQDTSGKTTVQINRMGIARTFQNIRLFGNLSVEDNVKIGLHNQEAYSMFTGILRLPKYWKQERTAHERAMELLSIFDMQDLAGHKAGSLPYGAQRRLEIVRGPGHQPQPPAPGRAGGGHEPFGDRGTHGEYRQDPGHLPDCHFAH